MARGTNRYDEARLQGRLWTPSQLGTDVIKGWWDASDLSTLSFGTGVSQWNSKVGGINAAQTTGANQPTFSVSARNNRPGLSFNGTSQYLNISSTADWNSGTSEMTLFSVGYSASTGWRHTLTFGTGSGTSRVLGVSYTGYVTGTTGTAGSDHISPYSWQGLDRIAMYILPSGGSVTSTICADGLENTLAVTIGSVSTTTNPAIGLATYFNQYWNGVIQEVMFFNKAIPASMRRKLEGYAAWKWGLVGNLPASHPFINRPPLIGD